SYRTTCCLSRVVAGLVPATSILLPRCSNTRGRRDKPGDDSTTRHCRRVSSLGKPSLPKALFEPSEVRRPHRTLPFFEAGDTEFWVKLVQASHCHLGAVGVAGERVARCYKTQCREPIRPFAPRTFRP